MAHQQESQTSGERALLNGMNVGIISFNLDEDCTILWANEKFYSCTGYSEEECLGQFKTLRRLYGDLDQEFAAVRSSLIKAHSEGEAGVEWTVRLPRKDGEAGWASMSATITCCPETGSCQVMSVCSDVTELMLQKQGESRNCEEKNGYFKWMMDAYQGNIYISDLETYNLYYMNSTALKTIHDTVHLEPSEVLGGKCYEIIQGRQSPCPFCTNHLLNEESWYEWDFYNPVMERTFMIKNRIINWEGRKARIELSCDMLSTEFKLAKKDREREALLRTIPGGFARLDARDCRTVLWYGAGFLQLIGYTQEQFENELHSKSDYIYSEDQERRKALMDQIRITGESAVYESRIITHRGNIKYVTLTLCYVDGKDSWDGIPSYYSVGIDVTKERLEQARQRKALEEAYQAARVASSAKTNFLSSMSHDIRTPMNAIMGMAAIAQSNLAYPDKVRDCLGKINVSSRHLLNLINEVLDMSKIESGKIDLICEEVDLPDLIQNVADMCRPLIAQKHQEFQMSAGKVKHEKVIADGDRLQQVLMNLVSNAIKYTPEGGTISLRVNELFSTLPKKGQFEFILKDNGIGMSADYIPHIFEPFSRAEDSRISKVQGTGLGMAITENIVRMMNGTIEVQSEEGKGSQFTVSVPLDIQPEETSSHDLAGLPVLVVDDDQMVCENATALLDELGMRGSWVMSGALAVIHITEAHQRGDDFFAVILDWKMPDMDGLETVKAIRSKLDEDVPIIVISAYDYSDIEDEFLQAGANAFITKPLFKSKMLHVLQMFCASGKMGGVDAVEEKESCGLRGKRVLLVEDNELNREIAVELLQMQELAVDTVENGRRAVDVFEASAPGDYDAILMDIQMPVMNGYDATVAIRSLNRVDAGRIPIIALTANAFAADVGKARNVGMNDHIPKPIDMGRLVDVLKRWIG